MSAEEQKASASPSPSPVPEPQNQVQQEEYKAESPQVAENKVDQIEQPANQEMNQFDLQIAQRREQKDDDRETVFYRKDKTAPQKTVSTMQGPSKNSLNVSDAPMKYQSTFKEVGGNFSRAKQGMRLQTQPNMARGYISNKGQNFHEHDPKLFGKGKHRVNPDAVNHEFRRKLWDGQIPVKVTLYYKEITTTRMVRNLYVLLPRLNYLVYILYRVKTYFDDFVSPECIHNYDEMWFDFNGQPLRWNIPVGVQFDTLIGQGNSYETKQDQLPWELTFHYKGCPDDHIKLDKLNSAGSIIQYVGIDNLKFSYINSIKESHVLRMGSANEILAQMKKSDEEKLLEGLNKHNYEIYWEINQPLVEKHIADMKKYAVRIYSNQYQNLILTSYPITSFQQLKEEDIPAEEMQVYMQKFAQWEQDQYDVTIGDLLHAGLPSLFTVEIENDSMGQSKTIRPTKEFQIICHGMKLDLSTPLYWLQLNMSYLDNFVYISLHSESSLP